MEYFSAIKKNEIISLVVTWMDLGVSQVVLVVEKPLPNAGDIRHASSIPGSGRSPGGGRGKPLQYSCLENPHGQRSLAGYSLWGHNELDATKATEHACMHEWT